MFLQRRHRCAKKSLIDAAFSIKMEPCLHAPDHHVFEQAAEQRALAKRASVAVLGKRRMIRGRGFKAQSAKPAVREIEVHLLAKPPLGPVAGPL